MNERENFSGQRPQTFSCFVPYIYNLLKNSKPDDPTDMLSGKIVDDPRGGSAITRRVRPGVTRATARRPSSRHTARRSPARHNGRAAAYRAAPAWRSGRRGSSVHPSRGLGTGVTYLAGRRAPGARTGRKADPRETPVCRGYVIRPAALSRSSAPLSLSERDGAASDPSVASASLSQLGTRVGSSGARGRRNY